MYTRSLINFESQCHRTPLAARRHGNTATWFWYARSPSCKPANTSERSLRTGTYELEGQDAYKPVKWALEVGLAYNTAYHRRSTHPICRLATDTSSVHPCPMLTLPPCLNLTGSCAGWSGVVLQRTGMRPGDTGFHATVWDSSVGDLLHHEAEGQRLVRRDPEGD